MAFLDFLFGKGSKTKEFQNYNPQQNQALDQLLSGGQQAIPQSFDFLTSLLQQQPSIAPGTLQAPALRQFNEQILPGIAERFTSQFGSGSQRSSGFAQQLGQAGAGLAENLAVQEALLGQQQRSQDAGIGLSAFSALNSLLSQGLTPRTQQLFMPSQPGVVQQGIGDLAGGFRNLLPLKLAGLF